jgi:transposase
MRSDFQAIIERGNGGVGFAPPDGLEVTNKAERTVCHAVCWRKTSYATDSEAGGRFVERVLTLVASTGQQGRGVLGFRIQAVQTARTGATPPSLVPAGA